MEKFKQPPPFKDAQTKPTQGNANSQCTSSTSASTKEASAPSRHVNLVGVPSAVAFEDLGCGKGGCGKTGEHPQQRQAAASDTEHVIFAGAQSS